MNSKFSDKQIEAYAAAFEEGDAIWCGGEWEKVSKLKESQALTTESRNRYVIRNYGGDVATEGFNMFSLLYNRYRVTTLEHYVPQKGDKVIWLEEDGISDFLKFGQVCPVGMVSQAGVEERAAIIDNDGDVIFLFNLPRTNVGVIPRCDRVARNKFNVGDNVLVNKFIGGTIVEVLGNDKYLVSIVYRSGMEERNEFNGFQLELAKEEPSAPRVITFNEEEINEELNSEVTDFDMDLHHVLSDLESTLKSKNKDYGDSFKQSYDEFGMTAVNIRLTDKFNRFKQLAKGADPQVDESLKDTIKDIAGYMVLTLIELNREDDDDE